MEPDQRKRERHSVPLLRSILFVPVIVERFVQKAPDSGADVVCLDIEDSVPPAEKAGARNMAAQAIHSMPDGVTTFVRVNGRHTGLLEDDLIAIVRAGLDGIVLSKTHTEEDVLAAGHYLTVLERQRGMESGRVGIIPLLESAKGVLNGQRIAECSRRLLALSLGAEDLAVDMGLQRSEGAREIEWARAEVSAAAASAGLIAIDTPEPDYTDLGHLERDAAYARCLGFRGKYCIHPDQVAIANRVFSPTEQEIAEANDVVRLLDDGMAGGRAAIAVNGKMIDTPIYWQAKRLLEWAKASGTTTKE